MGYCFLSPFEIAMDNLVQSRINEFLEWIDGMRCCELEHVGDKTQEGRPNPSLRCAGVGGCLGARGLMIP